MNSNRPVLGSPSVAFTSPQIYGTSQKFGHLNVSKLFTGTVCLRKHRRTNPVVLNEVFASCGFPPYPSIVVQNFGFLLFRDRSEELRSVQSKRIQEEVCVERAAQLTMRQEAWRRQEEEEKLFAELWEGDRLAKEERESRDAVKQRRMNLQQVEYLRVQMEAVEQQRGQDRQLKEEEAQLLVRTISD